MFGVISIIQICLITNFSKFLIEIHPLKRLSDDVLLDIQEKITADIKNQLNKPAAERTRMLPTFVDKLPMGSESGDFLVLDFGGHFFRVAYVNIKKSEKILNSEQKRRIDQRRLTIRTWAKLTRDDISYISLEIRKFSKKF